MARRISGTRQGAYYFGLALMGVGVLVFLSIFVTSIGSFGDFSNFEGNARSSMVRALTGMALIVAGGFVRQLGARGAAGSGLVLDPSRAREDLEPYSRMAGGMLSDALEETPLKGGRTEEREVVRVRCKECRTLNDEDARFCDNCGAAI